MSSRADGWPSGAGTLRPGGRTLDTGLDEGNGTSQRGKVHWSDQRPERPRESQQTMTVRLAVIPGDGVGPEVVAATVPVLEAALTAQGETLETTELDWGGERFLREGSAMPADGADTVRAHDAVLFGAVGRP